MPDRSVIQWDKDDAEEVRFVKIDLLGLGMLSLLDMLPMTSYPDTIRPPTFIVPQLLGRKALALFCLRLWLSVHRLSPLT